MARTELLVQAACPTFTTFKETNMKPTAEQQEFQDAYHAWKAAEKRYESELETIIQGPPGDYARILPIFHELDALREKFMIAARLFVYWK